MSREALLDPEPRHPTGRRRTVAKSHISDTLDLFAKAAESDVGESLLVVAERCARAILSAQGEMQIWQVRIGLEQAGLLENLGKESLDALGSLGRKMGLVSAGSSRPPLWAMQHLKCSHGNRHTIWVRPETLAQRQAAIERDG